MDRGINKFIEKKIDETQNEITKEIEHSTIAQDRKQINDVLFKIQMVQIKSWNHSRIGEYSVSCILFSKKIFKSNS